MLSDCRALRNNFASSARRCQQFRDQGFEGRFCSARGKILVPIHVWKTHSGGLRWKLLPELLFAPPGQQCEGFKNDAVFRILPLVSAQRCENGFPRLLVVFFTKL